MRWLGQRSYSIYLWHWPVFVVTRPGIDIDLDGWTALAIRLAATLVLADLSFRFIERPIREGALGRVWARWTTRQRSNGRDPRWSAVPAGLVVGILVAALSVQVLVATPASAPSYLVGTDPASVSEADSNAAGDGDTAVAGATEDDLGPYDPNDPNVDPNLDVTEDVEPPDAEGPGALPVVMPDESPGADGAAPDPTSAPDPGATRVPAPTRMPAPTAAVGGTPANPSASPSAIAFASAPPSRVPAAATTKPEPKPTAKAAVKAQPGSKPTAKPAGRVKGRVLAIGDSVMRGASRALKRQFTSIEVNAAVSRQFNDGIRILRARAAAGTLPDVVVIHLGTNGPINKRQFDLAMAAAKHVRLVVFVNVRVPRPWEGYTNRTLSQNVGRYANAALVNWHDASQDLKDGLARDGIHVNSTGATAYARLIAAAVR